MSYARIEIADGSAEELRESMDKFDAEMKQILTPVPGASLTDGDRETVIGMVGYGLRNLIVGDDEQTRVADLRDSQICPRDLRRVRNLVEIGEYEIAYLIAIGGWLNVLSNGDSDGSLLRAGITAWFQEWNTECEDGLVIDDYMIYLGDCSRVTDLLR